MPCNNELLLQSGRDPRSSLALLSGLNPPETIIAKGSTNPLRDSNEFNPTLTLRSVKRDISRASYYIGVVFVVKGNRSVEAI